MSHANTDDNFLAQIQKAEKDAAKKFEKAKKKMADDLTSHEQKLAKALDAKLSTAREKAKDKLKAKQVDARSAYEKALEEGGRNVKQLEKDAGAAIEKQIPLAQAFFLGLLG